VLFSFLFYFSKVALKSLDQILTQLWKRFEQKVKLDARMLIIFDVHGWLFESIEIAKRDEKAEITGIFQFIVVRIVFPRQFLRQFSPHAWTKRENDIPSFDFLGQVFGKSLPRFL